MSFNYRFGLPHAKTPVNMLNSRRRSAKSVQGHAFYHYTFADGRVSDAETLSADVVPNAVAIKLKECFIK